MIKMEISEREMKLLIDGLSSEISEFEGVHDIAPYAKLKKKLETILKEKKNELIEPNTGEAIGLIRCFDDLGRIVVPKEYRDIMGIRDGMNDKAEMILLKNNKLLLKPIKKEDK